MASVGQIPTPSPSGSRAEVEIQTFRLASCWYQRQIHISVLWNKILAYECTWCNCRWDQYRPLEPIHLATMLVQGLIKCYTYTYDFRLFSIFIWKRKCHLCEIFVNGCTRRCHFDTFLLQSVMTFSSNDISVTMKVVQVVRKLTHWNRVTHICVSEIAHHWFR